MKVPSRFQARCRHDDDDGFVLLESLIAISLIGVIMAALAPFFLNSMALTNLQRSRQVAAQIANSSIETLRGLPASDLVAGHYIDTVPPVPAPPDAPASVINPWVTSTSPVASVPALVTSTTAVSAAVDDPILNNVGYGINLYLQSCVIATANPSGSPTPSTACASYDNALLAPAGVSYLRAVVAVSWTNARCISSICSYVSATLLSQASDSTFAPSPTQTTGPIIINPGPQVSTVGDTVGLQLKLRPNTGIPGYTWTIASGALPAGLALTAAGLVTGVATTLTPQGNPPSVTVMVTDGFGRTNTATFTWAVVGPPTITKPPDQTSTINTQITNLAVAYTCPNSPCTFGLTNAPVGLTIDSNGVISGTPTVAGTVSVTVSITDNTGNTATTGAFNWSVLSPASVCVPSLALPNGSFETPVRGPGADTNWLKGGITPGLLWNTTASDNNVELWANGGNAQSANGGLPISSEEGTQWAELNANGVGALYQDLTTIPGQTLQWSVYHRARGVNGDTTGVDVMQVQIGSTTSQSAQVPTGQASPMISDGPLAWGHYTGVYTVPPGQTTTRFQFAAITTSSGNTTVGNFIDGLSLNNNIACLLAPALDQTSTVNTAISPTRIAIDRGTGPFTWGGGSTLPAGLSISTDGTITGTPTVVKATAVLLTFVDATKFQQTVGFTWNVVPKPTVSAPPNQTGSVGSAVNLQLSASCLNSPCGYVLNNGPPGLAISSTGLITGTITGSAQVFNAATVTVTDASGSAASSPTFTWTVKPAPTVTAPTTQTSTVGVPVSLAIASTCGNPSCTFILTNAPAGLTISSSGVISGTATTPGTLTAVTVAITDAAGVTATTANFTWVVDAAPTVTSPGSLTTTVGAVVSVSLTSSCTNTPCIYTLTGAPTGLTINSTTGVISGTVTSAAQTFSNVNVSARDNAGVTGSSGPFAWTVKNASTVIAPANQTTSVGASVRLQLTSTCQNSPCTYVVNGGPAGLSVDNAGLITGTVTSQPQTFSAVTVTVTDAAGVSRSSTSFTWTVRAAPTITTPGPQTSTVGAPVSLQIASTCGNPICTWTLTNAPAGLIISSNGVITGTPATPGTLTAVSVTIRDSAGVTAVTNNFTWTVAAAPSVSAPAAQTTTTGTSATPVTLTSSCSNTPCTYILNNGPAGLSISGTGVISGTVSSPAGSFNPTITVTDASGISATSASFSWTVQGPLAITPPGNQTATKGVAITALVLNATGGGTPYTWSDATGTLPPGLTIATVGNQGRISGTPTTAGTYPVTITVKDAGNVHTATTSFNWVVGYPPLVPANPGAQNSTVSTPIVGLQLSASGGSGNYTWAVVTGLPAGLSMTSAGLISGSPSATGVSSVVVKVTDSAAAVNQNVSFTWTVYAKPTVGNFGNATVEVGQRIAVGLPTTCPNSPCSYAMNNGPATVAIDSSGNLTGTVTSSPQTFNNATFTVTDSAGATGVSPVFTVVVVAGPTVANPPNQTSRAGTATSFTVTSTGGSGNNVFTATGLPSWLTINSNTGVISGTAPATVSVTPGITVSVTDGNGAGGSSTSAAFSWSVINTPSAPTAVTVVDGDGQVTPTWTAPSTNNGSAITGYTATTSPAAGACTTTGALTCTITGLTNGVVYTVAVTATNAAGTGPASAGVTAIAFPALLTGTGHALWLDGADPATLFQDTAATTPTTTTGQTISNWSDKSGSNNDVSNSGPAPTQTTFGATGLTSPTFNGFQMLGRSTGFPTNADYSEFAVYRITNTNCTNNIVSGNNHAFFTNGGNGLTMFQNGSFATATGQGATGNSPYVGGGVFTTANLGGSTDVNGAPAVSGTAGGQNNDPSIQIGAYNGGNNFCGQIAEVIVLNRAVSTTERRTIEEYLGRKWSVTVTPRAPTVASASRSNSSSAAVSWTAPTYDGGSPVTGYTVTSSPGARTCSTTIATGCTVSGLTRGTPYTFAVTATNTAGTSTPSTNSNSVTP